MLPHRLSTIRTSDRVILLHNGRLEAAGLVQRKSDPQDRRRVLLALTPLGAERLEALAHIHLAGLGSAKAALSALDDAT